MTKSDGVDWVLINDSWMQMEDIVERMYQRMRTAYGDTIKAHKIKCNKCGANTFLSKKGNRVCSDLCWNKKKE